jgi:hypothetical protein
MHPSLSHLSYTMVFRSRFQSAPLDFGSDSFYEVRRSGIDVRLGEVASGLAPSLLTSTWRENQGRWCKGVNWNHFTLSDLVDICQCVGPIGLSVVMRMLAEDYRGVRSGMPDLLLWSMEQNGTWRRAMLSEVKGHNDRLSESQRAWIRALSLADIQVEVLRVSFDNKKAAAGAAASARAVIERQESSASDLNQSSDGVKPEPAASSGSKRGPTGQLSKGKKRQSSIDGFFSAKTTSSVPAGREESKMECIEISEDEVVELE